VSRPPTSKRAQVRARSRQVQKVSSQTVRLACADQGYAGAEPPQTAGDDGIDLQIIKSPEARKGFVLLPRRWVVKRSFGWANRFRRLARDDERLPETLAGLHFFVFAIFMLSHVVPIVQTA